MRRPNVTILALVLGAAAVVTALVVALLPRPVATVDGHPVTRAEVAFHMQRLTATVQDEARRTGQPAEPLLRQRALDQAVADKVVLLTAQQQGVLDEVGFAELMAAREDTNTGRAAALARGEVVYGLTSFDDTEFYDHLMAAVRTELGQRLSGGPGAPLVVDDAAVEAYYDRHAGDWRVNASTYRVVTLTVPARHADDTGCARLLAEDTDLAAGDLATEQGCPGAEVLDSEVDGADRHPPGSPQGQLLATVSTLEVGRLSAPHTVGDVVQRHGLLDLTTDREAALAEYRPRLRAALTAELLSEHLDQRRQAAHVDVHHDRLATTEPEDHQ